MICVSPRQPAPATCMEDELNQCVRSGHCATLTVWKQLDQAINGVVDSITPPIWWKNRRNWMVTVMIHEFHGVNSFWERTPWKSWQAPVSPSSASASGIPLHRGPGQRSVGRLVLIDNDTVSITNINRQSIAYHSTVGIQDSGHEDADSGHESTGGSLCI